MRIVQLTDRFAPARGGIERHVEALSVALSHRGHEVTVVTLTEGDETADGPDDVTVRRIAGWERMLRPIAADPEAPFHPTSPDPGVVRALRRVLDEVRPDVVHAHGWIVFSYLSLPSHERAPVVVTLHDYAFMCAKRSYIDRDGLVCSGPDAWKCARCCADHYGLVKGPALSTSLLASHPLLRSVHRVVAVSTAVARSHARSFPREIDVVPSFVDDAAANGARGVPRPAFVPARGDYVLFAGALAPHKGIDVLLDAYDRAMPGIPLVLAGLPRPDSPTTWPSGVIAVDGVPHDQVLAALANCAIAVVPSTYAEPFGLVAAEAMACGRPVIASAIGGLTDIVIDGETGLLVPPGDASALAAALRSLLADADRRAAMGSAGAARATALDGTDALERIYEELAVSLTRSHARTS